MKASSALARGNRVFRRFFRDPARASFRRSGSSHRSRTSRQPAGPNRPKSVLQVSRQTLTFRPATWQHVLSAYDRNSGKVSATSDGTRGSVSASAAPAIRHNAAAKGETQPADFRPHGLKNSGQRASELSGRNQRLLPWRISFGMPPATVFIILRVSSNCLSSRLTS